jgi:hypothetical protein
LDVDEGDAPAFVPVEGDVGGGGVGLEMEKAAVVFDVIDIVDPDQEGLRAHEVTDGLIFEEADTAGGVEAEEGAAVDERWDEGVEEAVRGSEAVVAAEGAFEFVEIAGDGVGEEVDVDVGIGAALEEEGVVLDELDGFVFIDAEAPEALDLGEDGEVAGGLEEEIVGDLHGVDAGDAGGSGDFDEDAGGAEAAVGAALDADAGLEDGGEFDEALAEGV